MGGRQYLVAPATLIKPGVLNGSQGPGLYTIDEIRKNPHSWNHIPLVVYHPTVNGQSATAREPDFLSEWGIGLVLGASANGSLAAETWFDIENTRRIDEKLKPAVRILPRLERGDKIELSTGLGLDPEPAEGKTEEGIDYKWIAKNFQPDHVAVLPDLAGACSVADGCGINNEKGDDQMPSQTEVLIKQLIDNCDCWSDEDKDLLVNFSEKKLNQLIEHAKESSRNVAIANAVAGGFEDTGGNKHEFDADKLEWSSTIAPPKEDEESTTVQNTTITPQTEQEWFDSAPQPVRDVIQHAIRLETREKDKIVTSLVANAPKEKQDVVKARLDKMSLPELEDLAPLAIPPKPEDQIVANYFGSASPRVDADSQDEGEPLAMPVVNYAELAKRKLA